MFEEKEDLPSEFDKIEVKPNPYFNNNILLNIIINNFFRLFINIWV